MTAVEATKAVVSGPKMWPLTVEAYHVLGEMGLIPEKTELLYGQVFHKMPKSPLHRQLMMRLLEIIRAALPAGLHERQIEVHRKPAGDEFTERSLHGPGGQFTSAAVPGITVKLDDLFAN